MARKSAAQKESLVEWVLRGRTEAQPPARPAQPPKQSKEKSTRLALEEIAKHPRYVPLKVWATMLFGEYIPHKNTLLKWVHEGFIQPQPVKIGRGWYVKPDAEYVPD